jgi:hypothetical protein
MALPVAMIGRLHDWFKIRVGCGKGKGDRKWLLRGLSFLWNYIICVSYVCRGEGEFTKYKYP